MSEPNLSKIEAVMQATLEVLQEMGLHGFRLELALHGHYENQSADKIATQALLTGHYESMELDSAFAVRKAVGRYDTGSWGIVSYAHKEIVQKHFDRLQEIIAD